MDVDQARIVHFEEGIIMDILSRLSVRSLHRYKCVSKFWNTLISDPYFKIKHFNRAKNDQNSQKFLITHLRPTEFIYESYCCPVQMFEDVQKLDCPLSSKPLFRAMCSCDGFVIVIVSGNFFDKRPIHLLWNPSIRESIVLPAPEFELFDTTRYGFGYDSTSGDYKILRICYRQYDEILALKGGSWRKIDKHPHVVSNVVTHTSYLAFVHEAFHWIGSLIDLSQVGYPSIRMSRNYSLVSFSISKEVYGEIPFPEQLSSVVDINYLGVIVLDGMLSVYSVTSPEDQNLETLKLWVLKDYSVKESWSALFTVEDPSFYRVIPKYRLADGELLFSCFYVPISQNALCTSVGPFTLWLRPSIHDIVVFTESLISPKSLISYV